MLYCCESCGKKYTTEEKALECESIHAEERAKRDELEKVRKERANELCEMVKAFIEKYNKYYEDYGRYPDSTINFVIPNRLKWYL